MSSDQRTWIPARQRMAGFNDIGVKERDDRLAFVNAALPDNRTVESSKDLTTDEAARVITAIDKVTAGELTIIFADGTIQRLEVTDDLPLLPDEEP